MHSNLRPLVRFTQKKKQKQKLHMREYSTAMHMNSEPVCVFIPIIFFICCDLSDLLVTMTVRSSFASSRQLIFIL